MSASLAQVDWRRVAKLDTRRYAPQYLSADEVEHLPWAHFVDRLPVLFSRPQISDGLEMVAAGKSLTWSDRDLNIYVGNEDRRIRSFLDLSAEEFVRVFAWHLDLARSLSAKLGDEIYLTHGFNPEDTSPDAHSLASRFHTHVHVPQSQGRRQVTLESLTTFERLALIEPLADVFYDRAALFLGGRSTGPWTARPAFGFFTMSSRSPAGAEAGTLRALHALLADLHSTYADAVDSLTDGSEESSTGCTRKVPRPRADRERRMARFTDAGQDWLSRRSTEALAYLASHLAAAEPREDPRSTRIANPRQLWLAKGFSGALNFVVSAHSERLRCDFAPRVISTSGAAKVIGPGPTLVVKDQGPASVAERRRMADFHAAAVAAAATSPRPADSGAGTPAMPRA